jgi:RimJ/RimL family protein N-acetyltransferase
VHRLDSIELPPIPPNLVLVTLAQRSHAHTLILAQRNGYATEIGREGLTFAFEELGAPRVIAFTEVHNMRSRAVMERLGMAFAGNVTGSGLAVGGDEIWENAVFAVYWTDVKRK